MHRRLANQAALALNSMAGVDFKPSASKPTPKDYRQSFHNIYTRVGHKSGGTNGLHHVAYWICKLALATLRLLSRCVFTNILENGFCGSC